MISFVSGKIHSKSTNGVVVLTPGGVGYAIGLAALHTSELSVGQEVSLPTYLRVTDSALDLYGFRTDDEREFFVLLLSVSGVGPKSAMNILSLGSIADIKAAIARDDVKYLTAVQGMGKKTAERMVVELKSKVQTLGGTSAQDEIGSALSDVVDGLVAMGYSKEQAKDVARGLDATDKSTEALLREALRQLS